VELETTANLLKLLGLVLAGISKCALKSLNNQADFDSAILSSLKPNVGPEIQDLAVGFGCSFLEARHLEKRRLEQRHAPTRSQTPQPSADRPSQGHRH
jgi:hypothetical protein